MKTKGKRLDGIFFTNADLQYAGKLDDPQGCDVTLLITIESDPKIAVKQTTSQNLWPQIHSN